MARRISPKSQWKLTASTSADQLPHIIDDRLTTAWRSDLPGPQWMEIDLGQPAELGAVELFTEWPTPKRFRVQTKNAAGEWETIGENRYSEGRLDLLPLKPTTAQHVRLELAESSAGSGFVLQELTFLAPEQSPRVLEPFQAAWNGNPTDFAELHAGDVLTVDLGRELELQGLVVFWTEHFPLEFEVEMSRDGAKWEHAGRIEAGTGDFDSFWWHLRELRYLRIRIDRAIEHAPVQVRDLRIRVSPKNYGPLGPLEKAAQRSAFGHYPVVLRRQQVYWTVVGTPHDDKEALLDEYGGLEPQARKPSIHPLLLINGQVKSLAQDKRLRHSLFDDSLPIPTIRGTLAGIDVEIEAVADWEGGSCPLAVQYRLSNRSQQAKKGEFALTVRPVQVNPEWQHGGFALIHELEMGLETRVNGEPFFIAVTPPASALSVDFSRGDIVEVLKGARPPQECRQSDSGLLSGALLFPFDLEPGASTVVEIRAALRPETELRPERTFDEIRTRAAAKWREKLGPRRIQLGDPTVAHTYEAQIGYTLVNQNGDALQPGSRNYDRTWIRDGAAHALLLMQSGLLNEARRYLLWYGQRVLENGLVPPILNPDGSVNTGHGSNIEFDAQGELLFAATEYFRYTQDREFLETIWPHLKRALHFTQELRERTMAEHPPESRMHGILAPSISHEGYGKPAYSYWDNFWALRGWRDGAELADAIGDHETAAYAREQRALLFEALKLSIERTRAWKDAAFIPSSADLCDFDPTSTSIAYYPCDTGDVLPTEWLNPTYDRYLRQVRERYAPDWSGQFTPYELRNINAFVGMGMLEIAHELLQYLMSCRRPAGWNHWAEVVTGNPRLATYIGDMPHTWIGAELCAAIRQMLVRETADELILLAGIPRQWLRGKGIRLNQLPTHFGELNLTATMRGDAVSVNFDLRRRREVEVRVELPFEARVRISEGTRS